MADLTRIYGRGKVPFTVAAQYAPRFQALLDDPEWGDYAFDAGQSGGYNPRNIAGTNTPSQHSFGRAIDINWTRNARGTPGDIDPALARKLAARHGFTWGGDWKNPDPMHFEIADASPEPLQQRSLTSYAGLGGPPQAQTQPQDTPMGILSKPKLDPQEELMGILGNQGSQAGWQALTQLGAGIAAGANQGWGPGIGMGLSNASEAMQGGQNQRLKALQMLAGMQNSGAGLTDDIKEYQFAVKQGFKGNLTDFMQSKQRTNPYDQYAKAGAIFQGKDGNYYTLRLAGDGTQKLEPVGAGMTPARGFIAVGDSVLDKGAGTLSGTDLGPAIAGGAAQQVIGEAAGKATASAPADITAANNALKLSEKIRTNPGIDRGTGLSSAGNFVWGSQGYDFQNLVDQAKSGAFLTAIQQMRGLGSLSNAEGDTATKAVTRMNTATSKEAFLDALGDYEVVVKQGIARAQARINSAPPTMPGAIPGQPDDGWTDVGGVKIRVKP